jgi:hypothetical protein
MAVEKAEALRGVSFDKVSNGAPGIETLLAIAYSEGVAKGRITVERLVDVLATTPARLFGLGGRAPSRPAATRTSCSSTRRPRAPCAARPPPHERLHAIRGIPAHGRRPLGLRPRPRR